MNTDRNTVTLTLRVVGINSNVSPSRQQHLPIMMTGVFMRAEPVRVARRDEAPEPPPSGGRNVTSGADGRAVFTDLEPGHYDLIAGPGRDGVKIETIEVHAGRDVVREIVLPITLTLELDVTGEQRAGSQPLSLDLLIPSGRDIPLRMIWSQHDDAYFENLEEMRHARVGLLSRGIDVRALPEATPYQRDFLLYAPRAGHVSLLAFYGKCAGEWPNGGRLTFETSTQRAELSTIEGSISVGMRRAASSFTPDVPLWVSIRDSTNALSFDRYHRFMSWVFCNNSRDSPTFGSHAYSRAFEKADRLRLPFTDTDAYRNIKVATEAFVMANCGISGKFDSFDARYVIDQVGIPAGDLGLERALNEPLESLDGGGDRLLPYLAIIRRKLDDQRIKETDIGDVMQGVRRSQVDACYGLLRQKLTRPCLLELIWSYWQEEGMLVQTMNALTRRFQNIRAPMRNDPLANLEIDPLRPLNNLIWGMVQDEQHRLSVVRRNYEYDHHYGLRLAGRAVRDVRSADSRSRFLEAFHTLLSITAGFYKRDDDTTIVADGFPVLNALKEAHLILSQGAHNQFGDLPSTARIEMLMQQWILARPEFREFLPTRIMVAYPEPWMDRVDAMKKLQGWTDTSVLHFRNLAVFGEQVLLSIRYDDWAAVNDPVRATNWARYWRPEIQGYMHAYRSVTGVDLSVDVTNARIDAYMPSVHLVQRLVEQRRSA